MKTERNHTRRCTSDYHLVYHFESHQVVGRVANLSVGGLMVIATQPLSVHRVYKLQLVFPRRLFDKEWITFTAESRWSKYNNHADWWEVGLEIREIDADDIGVLQRVIHQLMMDESQPQGTEEANKNKPAPKVEYIKTR